MKLPAFLNPFIEDFRNENKKIVLTYLFLAVLLMCYIYLGKYAFLRYDGYGLLKNLQMPIRGYAKYIGWFFSSFIFLFVVPVIAILLTPGYKLKDFGLGLGDYKYAGKVFLFFSGLMLLVILFLMLLKTKSFLRYYPMFAKHIYKSNNSNFLIWFIILEISYFFYFIGWEFFYRSLLIFPLEKKIGNLSVLIGVIPFALMHVGKPVPEAFGSIAAAYFLGLLVLKVRSFWICPIIHFFIAFAMDLWASIARGLF